MKKLKLYILLAVTVAGLGSCKKFLDINQDPNNPGDANEQLLVPAIQSHFAYQVAGGYPVRTSSFWVKHLAYAAADLTEGNYQITGNDVNDLYTTFSYSTIMMTCKKMIAKAAENENPSYEAIGKIMLAWNMSYITDAFGDAPYTDAFKGEEGVIKAKYDSQEVIYDSIQKLLDEAIIASDLGGEDPGNYDFLYGGDMELWKKLANTLKARFYLRLAYAPNHTAATQATAALAALDAGALEDNSEAPTFQYIDAQSKQNPWFQFSAEDGNWTNTIRPAAYYVDMLNASSDPRLPFQVAAVDTGVNAGKFVGVYNYNPPTNIHNYSAIGSFYAAPGAKLYLLVYAEVPFLRAEAEFLRANRTVTTAVRDAYQDGIVASMQMYGITNYAAYLTANALSNDPTTAYTQIMTQKYIANYLQFEAYNDFRRTGIPALPINNQGYPGQTDPPREPRINTIPVRFPTPAAELLYNASNVPANVPAAPLEAIKVRVWWDPS